MYISLLQTLLHGELKPQAEWAGLRNIHTNHDIGIMSLYVNDDIGIMSLYVNDDIGIMSIRKP